MFIELETIEQNSKRNRQWKHCNALMGGKGGHTLNALRGGTCFPSSQADFLCKET